MELASSQLVTIPASIVFLCGGPIAAWQVVKMIRHAWLSAVLSQLLDRTCCPHCGYHLAGLETSAPAFVCPECGGRGIRAILGVPPAPVPSNGRQ
jgi:hypothetical protein